MVPLGVIKNSNDSERVDPSFVQPKSKTNPVRFISGFRNLNNHKKRKPYPMPKINGML